MYEYHELMKEEEIYDTEEFRNHIGTVDEKGNRNWIYPKKPTGKFYNARTYVSWILLLVLFGLPFIKINGEPFVLLNIIELKFILFGIIFTPQDLHLLALAMITMMLFVVLFTVVFGRLFCGWVCPQTIFMEMVFRKIEYWIEGSHSQQIKLNKAPWTKDKIFKKTAKHIIFFAIAVVIANTFLSYIIGVDQVFKIIQEPIQMHIGGFTAMLVFSFLFYFVFAWFREQVCLVVCPYGRLQSVLLVPESIVVIYDWVRGEPRGRIKKQKKKPAPNPIEQIQQSVAAEGDCVACNLCVKVCPTGIDIRNGTQLECVNCTACMDACDEVMEKVGREKGLIRYDSETGIKENQKKLFTPRVKAYSGLLFILIIVQGFLLTNRGAVETVILRTPGMLYQEVENTHYSNLYNYQIINKTTKDIEDIRLEITNEGARIKLVGGIPDAKKQGMAKGSFFVEIEKGKVLKTKNKITIQVYSEDELVEEVSTNFLGPIK